MFVVLKTVTTKVADLFDVMPCSLGNRQLRFRETCLHPEDGSSRLRRKVNNFLTTTGCHIAQRNRF
jgi:hypothetical protein